MRLELSSYVEGDLDGIADFITQDNPRRALTFIQDIRAKFHDILRYPMIYQLRPDIGEEARVVTIGIMQSSSTSWARSCESNV